MSFVFIDRFSEVSKAITKANSAFHIHLFTPRKLEKCENWHLDKFSASFNSLLTWREETRQRYSEQIQIGTRVWTESHERYFWSGRERRSWWPNSYQRFHQSQSGGNPLSQRNQDTGSIFYYKKECFLIKNSIRQLGNSFWYISITIVRGTPYP